MTERMKDKTQMLDKSWKEKFNEIALEQGKERYMGNRVADLKKDGDQCRNPSGIWQIR